MKKKPLPALSAAEQSIMGILWRRQRAGVLELLDEVNAGRGEPVTRTTLQTQLARLEAKGWIARDPTERAHWYSPAVPEDHGRAGVVAEMKRRLFGGSGLALVRCLVESGQLDEDDLAELRHLVRASRQRKEGGK